MFKRIFFPIVIVAIAIMVFALLLQSKPEKSVSQRPEKVWKVDTINVDFQTISPEIILYGRVETPRKSSLKSALVADVTAVNVLEGDTVKKGQLLVELDEADVVLLLEQRKAELNEINALIDNEAQRYSRDKGLLKQQKDLLVLAEKAVTRSKKLEQTKLLSQASLDDAIAAKQQQILALKRLEFDIAEHSSRLAQIQARKNQSESLLKQAELDLQRTKIVAPFDGRISALNVFTGDRLRNGDSILSIYDINNLEVRAQIPGRYIEQVRTMMEQGLNLKATSQDSSNAFTVVLKRLSGEVQLDSGGLDGLFRFDDNQTPPVLGSFVALKLSLSAQDDVVAIPSNALYGLNHVYIIEQGYMKAVDIQRVGEFENHQGEKKLLIRSESLQNGDVLVSTQLPNAITGLRVEALSE